MSQPFFSIVIPTYNRAHTVQRAIRSVLGQTFDDWEIVVVDDDKSTDNIEAVLKAFNDPRIRYDLRHKGKAAAARNRGVQLAKGRYIAFLDADDEYLPEKLEIYHRYLREAPEGLFYSQNYVNRGVGKFWIKPARGLREGEDIFDYMFIEKGWVHPSTVVVKTEYALECPFDETLSFGDDSQFAADLFKRGIKFRMIEQPLAIYDDLFDPARLSQIPVFSLDDLPAQAGFVNWVESQRPHMSEHAYLAYRAQFLSRFLVRMNKKQAVADIWQAYRRGALSAKAAMSQAVQTFFPRLYRRLADFVARNRGTDPSDIPGIESR